MSAGREVHDLWYCDAENCPAHATQKYCVTLYNSAIPYPVPPIGWVVVTTVSPLGEYTQHYCPAHHPRPWSNSTKIK